MLQAISIPHHTSGRRTSAYYWPTISFVDIRHAGALRSKFVLGAQRDEHRDRPRASLHATSARSRAEVTRCVPMLPQKSNKMKPERPHYAVRGAALPLRKTRSPAYCSTRNQLHNLLSAPFPNISVPPPVDGESGCTDISELLRGF